MVGFGYDIHKLAEKESLILGGISIESSFGTVAHSDGDVLVHSIIDALLGAAGLGDIGEHFPDDNMQYKNADSIQLLVVVLNLIKSKNLKIINIDTTIVLEKPKLSLYKSKIRENLAEILAISSENINIKAGTNEKLGFLGRGEAIASYCVCELIAVNN
jgi:2-C-methyl-D-erythritol 2,4-cyclodiphosphate synthase